MYTRHEPALPSTSPTLVVPCPPSAFKLTPAKLQKAEKIRKEMDSLRRKLAQIGQLAEK